MEQKLAQLQEKQERTNIALAKAQEDILEYENNRNQPPSVKISAADFELLQQLKQANAEQAEQQHPPQRPPNRVSANRQVPSS